MHRGICSPLSPGLQSLVLNPVPGRIVSSLSSSPHRSPGREPGPCSAAWPAVVRVGSCKDQCVSFGGLVCVFKCKDGCVGAWFCSPPASPASWCKPGDATRHGSGPCPGVSTTAGQLRRGREKVMLEPWGGLASWMEPAEQSPPRAQGGSGALAVEMLQAGTAGLRTLSPLA